MSVSSAGAKPERLRRQRLPESSTMVIFGATGDLTRRKLVPSLYVMHREGVLPPGFSIIGFARRDWTHQEFRERVRAILQESLGETPEDSAWISFAEGLFFASGEFDDVPSYRNLATLLDEIDDVRARSGNRLFYLAAPPSAYREIIEGIGEAGLGGRAGRGQIGLSPEFRAGWARIVVEKPFGHDLASAGELNARLEGWFREDQIFRIDHYLGKETVQNILAFRLANGIFEPVWDRQSVDHIQITVAEDAGVGTRGPYFEETGEIRDMIQNHVLQLLALVAMEPPPSFSAGAVRDERAKALRSLRTPSDEDVSLAVVRGQYEVGFIAGENVLSYRQEQGVSPDSTVETFVAARVLVDNWRWAGVPFYLRAGKRLPRRATEIAIQFKQPPILLFRSGASGEPDPNVLALHIQPDEGITLTVGSKTPGPLVDIRPVHMGFRYGTSFGRRSPEAYERLLLDSLLGDSTLFSREDSVDAAWRFVDRIRGAWSAGAGGPPEPYAAGTWGPSGAEELVLRDGRRWRTP